MDEEVYTGAEEKSFWSKLKDNLIELIEFVAVLIAVFIIIRYGVAEPHRVSGNSMVPNFHDGDYIITNKLSMRFTPFSRGEVIILKNPRNNDQVFIKRIIGLPSDRISITDGQFLVNGQLLPEPYLPTGTVTTGGTFLAEEEEIVVPDNQFFVAGDNRRGSSDSREWGPVETELIVGQAWLRYWPPQSFKLIQISNPSSY